MAQISHLRTRIDDAELQKHVIDELAFEPRVDAGEISVGAKDGVISLYGMVSTLPEKWAAEEAVRRVPGVRALACEINVDLMSVHRRTDGEIAAAASHSLAWHSLIAHDVQVLVEEGWVTLVGSVDWQYQRVVAECAVANVIGVRGITNEIEIRRRPGPNDVESEIRRNFERTAREHAREVRISVEDAIVTLHGEVPTWELYDAAERAAWSVAGVKAVTNHIVVVP